MKNIYYVIALFAFVFSLSLAPQAFARENGEFDDHQRNVTFFDNSGRGSFDQNNGFFSTLLSPLFSNTGEGSRNQEFELRGRDFEFEDHGRHSSDFFNGQNFIVNDLGRHGVDLFNVNGQSFIIDDHGRHGIDLFNGQRFITDDNLSRQFEVRGREFEAERNGFRIPFFTDGPQEPLVRFESFRHPEVEVEHGRVFFTF